MLKKVLFVALLLSGPVLPKMTGRCFADALAQLEQVETYKWYPSQAKTIYETIAQDYPGTDYAVKAQKNLVISYLSAKRDTEAQQTLDKLVEDFSGHSALPEALYDIARIYERLRKYEKAKSIYQQIIQQYPGSSSASEAQIAGPRMGVLSHIESKNTEAAQAATDSLISNFSSHSDLASSLYDIARRYERAKKYEEAKGVYQQIIQQYPGSSSASKAQLAVAKAGIFSLIESGQTAASEINGLAASFSGHSDLSEALYDIAIRYEKAKKYEEAKSISQQIIQQYPDSSHAARAQLIVRKLNTLLLIKSGNYSAAQAAVDSLIADFTGHSYLPSVLYDIARIYEHSRKYEKAKSIYQQVIQQYPESLYANDARLGVPKCQMLSYVDVGDHDAVAAEIDKLISDFSGDSRLPWVLSRIADQYYNQAYQMTKEGLDNEAKEYYTKALNVWERIIAQCPESSAAASAYHFSGVCYSELGEHEKAVEYFGKVVDNWSGYKYGWSAQFLKGTCLERLKDSGSLPESQANPKIQQAYEAVVERYPDCPLVEEACLKLGRLNFKAQQWIEAAQYFELFLSEYAGNERPSDVLYGLGRAYEEMGELNSAAETYGEFITVADPNDHRAEEVKTWLKNWESH